MDISKIKKYLRVDHSEEDDIIEGFVIAAKQYLTNAGVEEQPENELYNIVVQMLTALFYESRGTNTKIPHVVNNFIVQLSCKGKG